MLKRPKLPASAITGPWLWVAFSVLLGLGTLTTLADLIALPQAETRRANASQQRLVIDPVTGMVAGLEHEDHPPSFDVGALPENTPATVGAHPETHEAAKDPAPAPVAEESAPADEPLPAGLTPLRTHAETPVGTVARSHDSLITAPAPEVTEKTADGLLPHRGENGVTPSTIYAQPFTHVPGKKRVAIVVLDVGISPGAVALLMDLPREITVALSPYTRSSTRVMEQLRNHGMETWGLLPTMTARYPQNDPGPLGLISAMPKDEQMRRLHGVMTATLGAVGFVLPLDETYSEKRDSFGPILKEIDARGMLLLSTHPTRSIPQLTTDTKLRAIIRRADQVLDPVPNEALIRSKLAGLPTSITADTILLSSARPQTLLILAEWLKSNPIGGELELAPLSALYQPDEAPKPPQAPAEEKGGHGESAPAHGDGDAKPEAAKPAEKPAETGHH